MPKPKVNTHCGANSYTAANERIVEFSSLSGGGLISFREIHGTLIINLYNCDKTVIVIAPNKSETQ